MGTPLHKAIFRGTFGKYETITTSPAVRVVVVRRMGPLHVSVFFFFYNNKKEHNYMPAPPSCLHIINLIISVNSDVPDEKDEGQ